MWDSKSSQSSVILESVYGCTLPESVARLTHMGWKVTEPIEIRKGIFVVTAFSEDRYIRFYTQNDRVVTVNFGKRGYGSIRFDV